MKNTVARHIGRALSIGVLILTAPAMAHTESLEQIESFIQKQLGKLDNPSFVINHSNDLYSYLEACHSTGTPEITVREFRNQFHRYRVRVSCAGMEQLNTISEAHGTVDALYAKEAIRRNTPLMQKQFVKKRADLKQLRGTIRSSLPEFYYSARANIAKDSILYERQIKPRDVIARGDEVDIVSQKGSVLVVSKGVALEAGMFDDLIRIENIRSGKTLSGRVIDSNTVQVR